MEHSRDYIKGKEEHVLLCLCSFLADGHLLIEDAPGVGKTTFVKYFAKAFNLLLSRIQFTNDLLPSDIIGANVYSKENENFKFLKGPIFGEIILADELNRASPKTQSALLQAMEEKKVSVEGKDYSLPEIFFVVATQNPHGQLGTYPLPESQIDRFMMKMTLGYLDKKSSMELFKGKDPNVLIEQMKPLIEKGQIASMKDEAMEVHCSDKLLDYIFRLLESSRQSSQYLPLSTRCGLDLVASSKAYAFLQGRDFVLPEDVKKLFPYVAGHRLVASQQSGWKKESALSHEILKNTDV
ncbi:MAG: MoxR family ATPase [Halobacteriovoraceae bacterium]|nr:MoxR family ATPase [Halobacteriovoraceae bacterium]